MKRQRIEITAQILMFCMDSKRKTRIMYMNNLSHLQLKNYLTLLTSRNLLAHNSDTYVTTEKGHRFLEAFAQLKDVLEDHTRRSFVEISDSCEVRAMLDVFPMSRDKREAK
ncbi:MAG: hypothetical protein JSV12_05160 [Candidatus Bathyarchaeota archaeon]|nr:MAG: hypothetical protein JSV12_05160 [Candidatus Bathyarchaeota archaeon]